MSLPQERGLARLGVLAIPVLALVAVAIVITFGHYSRPAGAGAGVDFAIAVDRDANGTDDCTTRASGPTKCTIDVGVVFLVKYYLDANAGVAYTGFDTFTTYAGVTSQNNALMTPGFWPDCAFPAAFYPASGARFGCAEGIGAAPSTYTGQVATLGFTCAASGAINLVHGTDDTNITDGAGTTHPEGEGTMETLTINCGSGPPPPTNTQPGPTNTPTQPGPTNTPGPTATRTNTVPATATPTRTNTQPPPPPTATRTATPPKLTGDVNDDHAVTSQDALMALQYEAGIRTTLPNLASGDVNGDGEVNSVDALFMLWIKADLL